MTKKTKLWKKIDQQETKKVDSSERNRNDRSMMNSQSFKADKSTFAEIIPNPIKTKESPAKPLNSNNRNPLKQNRMATFNFDSKDAYRIIPAEKTKDKEKVKRPTSSVKEQLTRPTSAFSTSGVEGHQMIEKSMRFYRVTTKGDQILSENIQIKPFKILSLLELKISHSQGEHGIAEFKGVVSKEEANRILQLQDSLLPISISKRTEAGQTFSFYEGIAVSIELINEGDVYYIHGESYSHTYLMDIKRKRRSFQLKTQSYEQIVSQVLGSYNGAGFLDTVSNGQTVNQFLTQFDETDWAFIKRLASHFNRQLVAIDQYNTPKFYFGLPNASVAGEVHSADFQIEKDLAGYRQIRDNQGITANEQAFLRYKVKTNQVFILGDKVRFLDEEWQIIDLIRVIERGALQNHYILTKAQGVLVEKEYNEQLIGSSINGTVKSVAGDKVLLDLAIDQGRNAAAYWFPYSTNYTSDDNVGWYMMPEVGELVRLYYPTRDEKDAVAMSTVRTDDDSASGLDPAIKTLRNKFGKTITLEPNKITIVGNGVEIILNDGEGINITSSGNVSVTAGGALSLKGRNVVMDASDSVNISSGGNTISVNDKIVLNGSEIKMN
ncbi:contractile injection system protein, VgrG/Pvc8 family [Candidatus Enterococcus clewellii]|uniref:Gp5/Type VI secretion system Vgr protein OB-fold domain-containing protein n=1 Tax=Candidatus Enterococcus clewellii TaxID=1834193 RepID=A0A242KD82_9ENTE|nr:contractile injection system protein, VgrG/Pvc8 family [Enterococcus sp. 9E7_DIV0242]OTP19029.1 hypothetical protein A5888_000843 [Enterococcus sp. 9E7_DIV0242]